MGNEKGFQLTWTRDSTATCGYTIEWCMLGIALPCNLQWRKVPANQTFLNLTAGRKLFVHDAIFLQYKHINIKFVSGYVIALHIKAAFMLFHNNTFALCDDY